MHYIAKLLRINSSLSLILFVLLSGGTGSARTTSHEWRAYGNDAGGMRFSPLTQINRRNVRQLKRVWTYHTREWSGGTPYAPAEVSSPFECTPLVIDGVLYVSTPSSRVIALDAETGRELWQHDPQAGSTKRKYQPHRGVAYWEGIAADGRRSRRILFGTFDGRLIALDAATGKPCPGFGVDGTVNLRLGVADDFPNELYAVTSPPAIYRNLVIVGARVPEYPARGPAGDVRAFDVRTGQLVWTFHTVPHPGEAGHETWAKDSWQNRTGANVWSMMSVDQERGLVFLPIGSPAYDFYGGDRAGDNLYANSLVALDAATGKRVWHFQFSTLR